MKKYLILSGVLALAACGGGGGHHHHSDDVVWLPDPETPAQTMPHEVQSWATAGGTPAATSATATAGGDQFTFTLDNTGAVTGIVRDGRTYSRDGNNNAYINNAGGDVRTINLALLGKEAGLSYADFGYVMETEIEPGKVDRDFDVFAGGYASKEYNGVVNSATYRGTAVAYIESSAPGEIANKIAKTTEASLNVDAQGHNTFTMNFSQADNPWYDVTVRDNTFSFAGGEAVEEKFRMTDAMKANVHDTYVQTKYYDDGREVSAAMGFDAKDAATGREIDFEGAFGGIRQ